MHTLIVCLFDEPTCLGLPITRLMAIGIEARLCQTSTLVIEQTVQFSMIHMECS